MKELSNSPQIEDFIEQSRSPDTAVDLVTKLEQLIVNYELFDYVLYTDKEEATSLLRELVTVAEAGRFTNPVILFYLRKLLSNVEEVRIGDKLRTVLSSDLPAF